MNIIETIIQQIDIIDFIGKYTNLHQSGRYWKGKCPLHESCDTSETLVVFPDTNSFYCFSCECGGTVINFLSDKDKISYRAATEILAKECNISLKDNKEYQLEASEEIRFTREADMHHKNVGAIGEYLAKRGLTNSTINDFNLGFHSDCLTIPLRNEHGQYVSMAIRQFNKKPKYKNSPNSILYKKSSFLFNLDLARKNIKDRLYLCEGYMDAISGHQMGEPTIAYCGSELHRDQIRKLASFIRKEITIVICPDNDEAGVKHLPRTRDHFQSMLSKVNVRVLIMPEECKDINDLLCAGYELADLPTEHIDIFVIKQLIQRYKTIEEQYVVAEAFLKTIRSPMIRAEAIQTLGEIWKRDVSDLKAYFDSGVSSEQDLLETLHDASSSLSQLRDIYKRGTYPTHFQLLDNCIGGISKGQVFLVGAYSASGKSLTLSTPLITPTGKITMGDAKVGTVVIGEDGCPTTITAVYPQGMKDVYRVTFRDGTYVDCCDEHLWKFKTLDDLHRGNNWQVKPLKDIIKGHKIVRGSTGKQGYNLYIPVPKATQYKESQHIVDPYVMGALLGDGGFSCNQIYFTNTEEDVIQSVLDKTSSFGHWRKHNIQYRFNKGHGPNPLTDYILGYFGKIKGDKKFIPNEYMVDSIENRLQLVRGLIDTDGSVDKSGIVTFYSCNKRLAEDFADIIRSLGSRCIFRTQQRKDKSTEYTVRILERSDKWFTSQKHLNKYNSRLSISRKANRKDELAIVSIQKMGYQEPMQCITVDNDDHMYLCGDYIPTHNTDVAIEYILRQIVQNKANVVFFSLEMPRGKIMERIVCKILKKRISEVKELIIQGDPLVNQVLDKIGKKLYIVDENNLSMHDIERYINTINTRNLMEGGVDVIVVDYFTYLKGAGDYDGASEQALMMKGIAKRYNVIFTMLSQLNRSGNTYEEPTMNQLRMTGDLEASADYILMIWRPDKAPNLSLEKQQELRNITRCKVEKARDGMNGPPMFELKYNVHTSRLEEVLTTDN